MELIKLGIPVKVVVPVPFGRKIPYEEKTDGYTTLHPRYFAIPFFKRFNRFTYKSDLTCFRSSCQPAIREYTEEGGRIVHSHSMLLAGISAVHLKRKFGLKVIVTFHDHEIQSLKRQPDHYRNIILNGIRAADHTIYVSEKLRNEAFSILGHHNSSVIPYGINEFDIEKQLPEKITLCTVSRLVKTKGTDILIHAAGKLIHEGFDINLKIIGEGPCYRNLTALTRHYGIQDRVKFLGKLPNSQAVAEISNSHIFVLPSYREALGLVYFEAFSVNTPVIGVRGQGINDYINHGIDGLLAEPGDRDSLKNAIKMLITNENLRNRIAAAGHDTFLQAGITWEKIAERHLQVYEEVLNS